MAKPGRIYAQIDVNWYEDWGHEVSPEAALFWVLMCCRAKQLMNDGKFTLAQLQRVAIATGSDSLAIISELEQCRIIVRASYDHYHIRGWAQWNESSSTIASKSTQKRDGAAKTNHTRWHEGRGVTDPKCRYCDQLAMIDKNRYSESPETETETETEKINKIATNTLEHDFEECWNLYPRKLAKTAALKAYAARRKQKVSKDELLSSTRNYAKAMTDRQPEFVLHGATFYGPNERWKDYLTDDTSKTIVAVGAPSLRDDPNLDEKAFYGEPISFE